MRAWLYYRLSRDEDVEMNSLQNRRQILVDYAEQNGYKIVGKSFDDNISEINFNRKDLGKLEIAVDEGIDSSNENDDLMIGFKQIFNDFYAIDIIKKVKTCVR